MMLAFTDQRERLRRIVENALADATYEASRSEEDGRIVVIEARRSDGRRIGVRFRGVTESDATAAPAQGSSLKLRSVGPAGGFSLLRLLFTPLFRPSTQASRVRIEAGSTRLEIVCQDAEWWEEAGDTGREPPPSGSD